MTMVRLGSSVLLIVLFSHFSSSEGYSRPSKACAAALDSCQFIDPESVSPYVHNQVFLNFTPEKNDRLCTLIEQGVNCFKSAVNEPDCKEFFGPTLDIGLMETFHGSICSGQGRKDLDEFARCANNQFLQREYYGRVFDIGGQIEGWEMCTNRSIPQSGTESICRSIQSMFISLPFYTTRYCDQDATEAVKRIMQYIHDVQSQLFVVTKPPFGPCRIIPDDFAITL